MYEISSDDYFTIKDLIEFSSPFMGTMSLWLVTPFLL